MNSAPFVRPDDVEFLRAIALDGSDSRCQAEAERALSLLLVEDLPPEIEDIEPSPPADFDPALARIRATILDEEGFPDDYDQLVRSLPDDAAAELFSDLLRHLLDKALTPAGRLELATKRLEAIVEAVNRGGERAVRASLPNLAGTDIPPDRRGWAGGLLTLVHPGEILAVAAEAARDRETRFDVLRALAEAAPRLAGSPEFTTASSADPVLVGLYRLLTHPVRNRALSAALESFDVPHDSGRALDFEPEGRDLADTPGRSAYARLDAPDRVPAGSDFELRVGLAPQPGRGVVASNPLLVPTGEFDLNVRVVADGFATLGTGALDNDIRVSPEDPYAYVVVRLRAIDSPDLAQARTIMAMYSVDGQFIGVANRVVLISKEQVTDSPVTTDEPAAGADWVLPTDPSVRPDLEILVAPGNDAGDSVRRLHWIFRSKHPAVGQGEGKRTISEQVAAEIKQFIAGVEARKDNAGLFLAGFGAHVGDAIPSEVWEALRNARAAVGGPPTVLLATYDAYVPWELAQAPARWLDDFPDVLGAEAVIGRWPYLTESKSPSPPAHIDLQEMAVVHGDYAKGEELPQATQEAEHLQGRYSAWPVDARMDAIVACLKGTPRADGMHMAVHGAFDPAGSKDGIYLVDGKFLSPYEVRGVRRTPIRFFFLNACQLGQGREILGSFAGMSAELLAIGAQAVIAPLWKVDDTMARTVAESFYDAVFRKAEPESVADFLRKQRAPAQSSGGLTGLAYVFFGHPMLRLNWRGAISEVDPATPVPIGP